MLHFKAIDQPGSAFRCLQRVKRPLEFALLTVWAAQDASTHRFVPGSHRWPQHRDALESEALCFTMNRGDVAIVTGHTQHSSWQVPHKSIHIDFSAGFVAEREVQTLSNPPQIARHYPKALQRLVGYETHGEAVSYYGDWVHPIVSFDLKPIRWAVEHDVAATPRL